MSQAEEYTVSMAYLERGVQWSSGRVQIREFLDVEVRDQVFRSVEVVP